MKVSQLDSKFNETNDRISRLEAGLETVVTKIQENTIMMYHIEWFKGVRNAMRKELSLLEHVKKSKINDLLICLKKGGCSLTEDNFESRFKNFNKQQVKALLVRFPEEYLAYGLFKRHSQTSLKKNYEPTCHISRIAISALTARLLSARRSHNFI